MRRLFDGTGGFAWASLGTAFVGTVFLIAIFASPGSWEWWSAKKVPGSEQNGIVYYTYGGRNYSVDDVNSFRTGPRSVWVDPSNPSNSVLHVTVAQASDSLVTGGPYAASVLLLVAGFRRKRRIRRQREERALEYPDGFGDGIDANLVRRLLSERQRPDG